MPRPVRKAVVARSKWTTVSPAACALDRTHRYSGLPRREIQTGFRDVQRATDRVSEEHAAQGTPEIALVNPGEQRAIGGVRACVIAHELVT